MTAKEILIAAKGKIDRPSKWCKHQIRTPGGRRMCAKGALNAASPLPATSELQAAYSQAQDALIMESGLNASWAIANYNDAPERTHEEIMAWFDRAIERVP